MAQQWVYNCRMSAERRISNWRNREQFYRLSSIECEACGKAHFPPRWTCPDKGLFGRSNRVPGNGYRKEGLGDTVELRLTGTVSGNGHRQAGDSELTVPLPVGETLGAKNSSQGRS